MGSRWCRRGVSITFVARVGQLRPERFPKKQVRDGRPKEKNVEIEESEQACFGLARSSVGSQRLSAL